MKNTLRFISKFDGIGQCPLQVDLNLDSYFAEKGSVQYDGHWCEVLVHYLDDEQRLSVRELKTLMRNTLNPNLAAAFEWLDRYYIVLRHAPVPECFDACLISDIGPCMVLNQGGLNCEFATLCVSDR